MKKSNKLRWDGDGSKAQDDRDTAPEFPYPLELVARIAAQFAAQNTDDTRATERAIRLLDTVQTVIKRKTILRRARKEAERLTKETPKKLTFAKGVRWITKKRTETEATKAFRDYLRVNLRLVELGHPSELTEEQMASLVKPLPEGAKRRAEDENIEKIMNHYRAKGFHQVDLINIQSAFQAQLALARPYQNSQKGKRGGRPRRKKIV